jgi:hypothetical protein
VQSLVVPAVEYQASKRFRLVTSKSASPIRFGRLIEQQPEWVWTGGRAAGDRVRTAS